MKKIYQKPEITLISLSGTSILAGSINGEEPGVVKPGQGSGTTTGGDEYITLSKGHNAWSTWDDDEEDE